MYLLYLTDLPHPYNKIGDGPEGPEARIVADKLRNKLVGKQLLNYVVDERAKISGLHNLTMYSYIVSVYSYGKKVIIELDNEVLIIISLGMEGRVQYSPGNHSHIRFDIGSTKTLDILHIINFDFSVYFDDTRYMGDVSIIPKANLPIFLQHFGPDLLALALDESTWISLDQWITIFNKPKYKNTPICKLLLDPSLVYGIGNYLKSEILYFSSIHPHRVASSLSVQEWDLLRINSHKIIVLSYNYQGCTIQSYISPDGQHGTYPCSVYHKQYDPNGYKVTSLATKDGRTSWFVPEIQQL